MNHTVSEKTEEFVKHFFFKLPKLVMDSMCTGMVAGGKTTYASCIVMGFLAKFAKLITDDIQKQKENI